MTVPAASVSRRLARPVRGALARYVLGVGLVVAAYAGAAQVSYHLEFAGPVAAIVWLPVGVGIACLTLAGPRFWPGVLVGDLLANDYTALPLQSALGQTVGNLAEVLIATVLIRRLAGRRPLENVRGLGIVVGAIAAATAVSATVGAASLWSGGVIAADDVPTVWRTWLLGDASGALVVVPLALAWSRRPVSFPGRGRALEAALLFSAIVISGDLALRSDGPLTYMGFPALIWAALRFGPRGATLAIAMVSGLTVWNTVHSVGPFAYESISRSVLGAQLYIDISALSTLFLAAAVSQRQRAAEGLVTSRARLVRAAESDRRRLERELHSGPQQRLAFLAMDLRRAADSVRTAPDEAGTALDGAQTQLALAVDELRELARGIHPAVVSDLGLAPAIRSAARRALVPVDVGELPSARLDETAEATAYQVFAVALANAEKRRDGALLQVRAVFDGAALHIDVIDTGAVRGTASDERLEWLRDRVETVGGSLRIVAAGARRARITAAIPARTPDGRATAARSGAGG